MRHSIKTLTLVLALAAGFAAKAQADCPGRAEIDVTGRGIALDIHEGDGCGDLVVWADGQGHRAMIETSGTAPRTQAFIHGSGAQIDVLNPGADVMVFAGTCPPGHRQVPIVANPNTGFDLRILRCD
ncbi:hypothetical protein [Nioella sp.]|uniref:hypothetical protein n=1 Tax=Nioella sp. TaxID=1912091 RepID=UPI003B52D12D